MRITLICEDKIMELVLPHKIRGKYWVEEYFAIEAYEGYWIIKNTAQITLPDTEGKYLVLEDGNLYQIGLVRKEFEKCFILAEADTQDYVIFKKYKPLSDMNLKIGRGSENDIVIDCLFASTNHAELAFCDGNWTIHDTESSNGVYINSNRLVQETRLNLGDVIYIAGFKIIIGNGFIAMNNPEQSIYIQSEDIVPFEPVFEEKIEPVKEKKDQIYYRSPRFRREIQKFELKIDPPPTQEKIDETPLALSLAPALVMGVASFSSGLVTMLNTINNGGNVISSIPTLIMSISMLMGMLLFPYIMRKRDKKNKIRHEEERREKYLKYLNNIKLEIERQSDVQKEIITENFPNIMEELRHVEFWERKLWSREIGKSDFLTLRLGIGNVPLQGNIVFPEQRFSIDDDVLRKEVDSFSDEKRIVENIPVVLSLLEHRISGIAGAYEERKNVLQNILLQMVAFHSYDEMKIVFICAENELEDFDYIRWLPHSWDNKKKVRYLITNTEDARKISGLFSKDSQAEKSRETVQYVVISTNSELANKCALVNEIVKNQLYDNFCFLALYDDIKKLPKECSTIIHLLNHQGMMINQRDYSGMQVNFEQDRITQKEVRTECRAISEYHLDLDEGRFELPETVTFLDMFHVGKVEHLNILERWRENDPVISLKTPIGISENGGLFWLDLHEKAHGPHGLIAGMTGSGKSEFIITLILSLALNYHPNEVSFILIDYKGGGLAGAFENEKYKLPHVAGTITNLDGSAINRSLQSIQSELKRRQTEFNRAKRLTGEATMDIYKYQKLYRAGKISIPMPHLFIVSDEFAELKLQQSDFMDQLISAARIGRSLGIHLILATQKPAGIVNSQITANTRFKVCLKVQDKEDSMEMLGKPEAAEIVETGRFYLQVGYNELFELGQSAWCGASYSPVDEATSDDEEKVQIIDYVGAVVKEAKVSNFGTIPTIEGKQIERVIEYICKAAEEENVKASSLWLPEIPEVILVDDLIEKYDFRPREFELDGVIGEYDDPMHQTQDILHIPFSENGNAIIYGMPGTGKTMLLQALLYSLYKNYSNTELQTYIVDFGMGALYPFQNAKQNRQYIMPDDDKQVTSFIEQLQKEVKKRRKILALHGGDYKSYIRKKKDLPYVLVVINNYDGFIEQYERQEEKIISILRDCTKYGIHFVVTCEAVIGSGIRQRFVQNFAMKFALRLNGEENYSALLGNVGKIYPRKTLGSGIFKRDSTYVFQTAHVVKNTDELEEHLKNCDILDEKSSLEIGQVCTDKTEMLEKVIGELKKRENLFVLSKDLSQAVRVVETMLLEVFSQMEMVVFDERRHEEQPDSKKCKWVDAAQYDQEVEKLYQLLLERNLFVNNRSESDVDMHEIVYVFVAYYRIWQSLGKEFKQKLERVLEKNDCKYHVTIILVDGEKDSINYCEKFWFSKNGWWIGEGADEQTRFLSNDYKALNGNCDEDEGYIFENGMATFTNFMSFEQE